MNRPPIPLPGAPLTDGTILLRLPDERDTASVYAYGQDPDIEETAWLPIPFPCPEDVAARTVREFRQGWDGRHGLTLIITMPPEADLYGVVHLSVHTAGVGEMGYGVAPPYRGRGLATRAVSLVAAWAFAHLELTCLEIVVTASGLHGTASRRVAEKAGFVYAGIRRSHVPATGSDYEDPLYVPRAPAAPVSCRPVVSGPLDVRLWRPKSSPEVMDSCRRPLLLKPRNVLGNWSTLPVWNLDQ